MKFYKRVIAGALAVTITASSVATNAFAASRQEKQNAILSADLGVQTKNNNATNGYDAPDYLENPFYQLLHYAGGNPEIVLTEGETVFLSVKTGENDTNPQLIEFSTSTIPALEALWLEDDVIRQKYNWDAYFDTSTQAFKDAREVIQKAYEEYIYDKGADIDSKTPISIDVKDINTLKTLKAMSLWVRLKTALYELSQYKFSEQEIQQALGVVKSTRDSLDSLAGHLSNLKDDDPDNDTTSKAVLTKIYNAAHRADSSVSDTVSSLKQKLETATTYQKNVKNTIAFKQAIDESGFIEFYEVLFTGAREILEGLQRDDNSYSAYEYKAFEVAMREYLADAGYAWNDEAYTLFENGYSAYSYGIADRTMGGVQDSNILLGNINSLYSNITNEDYCYSYINSWVQTEYTTALTKYNNNPYASASSYPSPRFTFAATFVKEASEEVVADYEEYIADLRNQISELEGGVVAYAAAYLSFIENNRDTLLYELDKLVVTYNSLLELCLYFNTTDSNVMVSCEETNNFENILAKYEGWSETLTDYIAISKAMAQTYDYFNGTIDAGLDAPSEFSTALAGFTSPAADNIELRLWKPQINTAYTTVYYKEYTTYTYEELSKMSSNYTHRYNGIDGNDGPFAGMYVDEGRTLTDYISDKNIAYRDTNKAEETITTVKKAPISTKMAYANCLWADLGLTDVVPSGGYYTSLDLAEGKDTWRMSEPSTLDVEYATLMNKDTGGSDILTQCTYVSAETDEEGITDQCVSTLALLLNTVEFKTLLDNRDVTLTQTTSLSGGGMSGSVGLTLPTQYQSQSKVTGTFSALSLSTTQGIVDTILFADDTENADEYVNTTLVTPQKYGPPVYTDVEVLVTDYRKPLYATYVDFVDTINYAMTCYDYIVKQLYGTDNSFMRRIKGYEEVLNYYCNDYTDFRDLLRINIGEVHKAETRPAGTWNIAQKVGDGLTVNSEITVPRVLVLAKETELNRNALRNKASERTAVATTTKTNPVHLKEYTLNLTDGNKLKADGEALKAAGYDVTEDYVTVSDTARLDKIDVKLMFNSATRGTHTICTISIPTTDLDKVQNINFMALVYEIIYNRNRNKTPGLFDSDTVAKCYNGAGLDISKWGIQMADNTDFITLEEYLSALYAGVSKDGVVEGKVYGISEYVIDNLYSLAAELSTVIDRDVYAKRYSTLYDFYSQYYLAVLSNDFNMTFETVEDLENIPEDKRSDMIEWFNDTVFLDMMCNILYNGYAAQQLGYTDECRFVVEMDYNYVVDIELAEAVTMQTAEASSGALTPIIPEYALSEYYEGFSDLPSAEQVKDNVNVDDLTAGILDKVQTGQHSDWGSNIVSPLNNKLGVYCAPTWQSRMRTITMNKEITSNGVISGKTPYTVFDGGIVQAGQSNKIDDNNALFTAVRVYKDGSKNSGVNQVRSDPTVYSETTWGTATSLLAYFNDSEATNKYVGAVAETTGDITQTKAAKRYTAVQRLCEPITQFSWDDMQATIKTDGDDTVRVYQSAINIPVLLWDFDSVSGVRNVNLREVGKVTATNEAFYIDDDGYLKSVRNNSVIQENGRNLIYKNGVVCYADTGEVAAGTSFELYAGASYNNDYHLWLAKTTEETGIRVADWVANNTLDAVFDSWGMINKTDTAAGLGATITQSDVTKLEGTAETDTINVEHSGNTDSANTHNDVDFTTTGKFRDYAFNKYLQSTNLVYCDLWDCFVPMDKLHEHQFMYYQVLHEGTNFAYSTAYREETHVSEYSLDAPSWQKDLTVATRPTATFDDTTDVDMELCDTSANYSDGYGVNSQYVGGVTLGENMHTASGTSLSDMGVSLSDMTNIPGRVAASGRWPVNRDDANARNYGDSVADNMGERFDTVLNQLMDNPGLLNDFLACIDEDGDFNMQTYDDDTGKSWNQSVDFNLQDVIDSVKDAASSWEEETLQEKQAEVKDDPKTTTIDESQPAIPGRYRLTYIVNVPYTVVTAIPYSYNTLESTQVCNENHRDTVYLYRIENEQGDAQYTSDFTYTMNKEYGTAQNPVPSDLSKLRQLKVYDNGSTTPSTSTTAPQPSGVSAGSHFSNSSFYAHTGADGTVSMQSWPPSDGTKFTIHLRTTSTVETFHYVDVNDNNEYDSDTDIKLDSDTEVTVTNDSIVVTWTEKWANDPANKAYVDYIEKNYKAETTDSYTETVNYGGDNRSALGGSKELFEGTAKFEQDGVKISGQQAAMQGSNVTAGRTGVGFIRENNNTSDIMQYTTNVTIDGKVTPACWFTVEFGYVDAGNTTYDTDNKALGYLYNTTDGTFRDVHLTSTNPAVQNLLPGTSMGVYTDGSFATTNNGYIAGYGVYPLTDNLEEGTPLPVYKFEGTESKLAADNVGEATITLSTNNYTIYEVIDQISQLEITQNDEDDGGEYRNDEFTETATVNPDNTDVFGNVIGDTTLAPDGKPTSPKWQSDSNEEGETFTVVPEVLMTYKAPAVDANGDLRPASERGAQRHIYVAGYNPYTLTFPQYNSIDIDYNPDTEFISGATATDSKAQVISKMHGDKPVVYTGGEANSLLKSTTGKVNYTTWVLDFNNVNVGQAWNKTAVDGVTAKYAVDNNGNATYAATQAQTWLNNFVTGDGTDRKFVMTACANVTFTKTKDIPTTSSSTYNHGGVDTANITVDGTVHKPVTAETVVKYGVADNTYYKQAAAYDIVIRNGRLAGVYAERINANTGVKEMYFYNLYRDGKITTTDDMLKYMTTQGNTGAYLLYQEHPAIAEAILNMNLVEFATTFANQSDVSVTTEWDTYKGWGIYEDNNGKSVVKEVEDATNLYATSDSNRTEGTWYGEDSTVFRIVKFTTEVAIPAEIGLTYKIPATYGYKSTANRGGIFSDKSKVAFGWLEVGFKLGNSVKADSHIAKVTDNSDKAYSSAWFDIIGNELIGSDVQVINPVYQFIISDGSVTNMHN